MVRDTPTIRNRNPIDKLLPQSLIHLSIDLDGLWVIDEFLALTGIPQTLRRTHETLPALRKIVVNYLHIEDDEPSQRAMARLQEHRVDGIELEIRYTESTRRRS